MMDAGPIAAWVSAGIALISSGVSLYYASGARRATERANAMTNQANALTELALARQWEWNVVRRWGQWTLINESGEAAYRVEYVTVEPEKNPFSPIWTRVADVIEPGDSEDIGIDPLGHIGDPPFTLLVRWARAPFGQMLGWRRVITEQDVP